MKKNLDSKTIGIALGVVALVLVVVGLLVFKPQIGAGPEVAVVPYAPPGSAGYGPNGQSGSMGAASAQSAASSAPEGSKESEPGPGQLPPGN